MHDMSPIVDNECADEKQSSSLEYKLMDGMNIPREKFLREQITKFITEVRLGYDFELYGHQGLKEDEDTQKKQTFKAVKSQLYTLKYFKYCVNHMINWHGRETLNQDEAHIDRFYAIKIGDEIIAGLKFHITITKDSRQLEVEYLSIQPQTQSKSLGTLLLLLAILNALVYQCQKIVLRSVDSANKFYEDRGFQLKIGSPFHELYLHDALTKKKLIKMFKSIAPHFEIKSIIRPATNDLNLFSSRNNNNQSQKLINSNGDASSSYLELVRGFKIRSAL